MPRRVRIWPCAVLLLGGLIAVWVARREKHEVYRFLEAVEQAETITIGVDVYDPNWYMTDRFHIELSDSRDVREVAEFFGNAQPNLASGTPQLISSPKRARSVRRFSLTATSADESQTVALSTDTWVVTGGGKAVELKGFSANALFAWLKAEGRLQPTSRPIVRRPPATLPVQPQDWRREVILTYLQREYPTPPLRDDGHPVYYPELFYMPQQSDLHMLSTPVLEEYLPHTRFSVTKISTNHPEYPEVRILLSVTESADAVDIRECFSPLYEDVWPSFLEQFVGLRADSDDARERLCYAIAELFAAITYRGTLRNGRSEGAAFVVELFHDRRRWRDIVFAFEPTGRLGGIELVNPHARP